MCKSEFIALSGASIKQSQLDELELWLLLLALLEASKHEHARKAPVIIDAQCKDGVGELELVKSPKFWLS